MADTWRVEARSPQQKTWGTYVDYVSRQTALDTAAFVVGRYPEWTLRLQDTSTGEVVHLNSAGKPVVVGEAT